VPGLQCLAHVAESLVAEAVGHIYTIIDNGSLGGLTEAQIIALLEAEAVAFAPDVWKCAMMFVSQPDTQVPDAVRKAQPFAASRAEAATIAADYLEMHP